MLIAVASTDGRHIDQHFGHANRFLIYDVAEGHARLVDEIKVQRYCSFDQAHPLRAHILKEIAAALHGCRAIICAQIGQAPQMEMERLGIDSFVADGPIHETLVELSRVL